LKLDLFSYPGMQSSKLFVVEALDAQTTEIADGDHLVVDSSWKTRFSGTGPTISPGNYMASRLAKLSAREVTSVHGDVVELALPDAPGRKDTFRVGAEGFTVHGRIIWLARALPIAAIIKPKNPQRATKVRKIR
jgi:hypothetical protein